MYLKLEPGISKTTWLLFSPPMLWRPCMQAFADIEFDKPAPDLSHQQEISIISVNYFGSCWLQQRVVDGPQTFYELFNSVYIK
jgi:hypothetical protein